MQVLTNQFFRFETVPGSYEYNGIQFEITRKITGFGSGKKTVYTAIIDGIEHTNRDITYYKKLFGVIPGPKPAKPAPAPKPAPVPVPETKPGQVLHAQFDYILNWVRAGVPVYLYGPAGTGKNVLGQQISDALGLRFYFSNCIQQEYKIYGYSDAAGVFHDTEFFKAWTNGGIFFMDELDASCPDVLNNLNAALANGYAVFGDGRRYEMHPDCRIIAAGNTIGRGADEQYTGRAPIDAATLNRFVSVNIDYDKRIEESICAGHPEILDFCYAMRKAAEKIGYSLVLGYRNLKYMVTGSQFADAAVLVESCVLKGVDKDTRAALRGAYCGDLNNKYYLAL